MSPSVSATAPTRAASPSRPERADPAHRRAAVGADLDEPFALELGEGDPDRRRRDAEALRQVAMDERRPLGELAGDDQRAERLRDALLDRLAFPQRGDDRHLFHRASVWSRLALSAI